MSVLKIGCLGDCSRPAGISSTSVHIHRRVEVMRFLLAEGSYDHASFLSFFWCKPMSLQASQHVVGGRGLSGAPVFLAAPSDFQKGLRLIFGRRSVRVP